MVGCSALSDIDGNVAGHSSLSCLVCVFKRGFGLGFLSFESDSSAHVSLKAYFHKKGAL